MRRRHEIRDDPAYDFRVGQLIGACEMAATLLAQFEDPEAKRIGEKLHERAAWFLSDDSWARRPALPPETVSSPTS